MEAQCKDGVRADGVASLIVAAGERRGFARCWIREHDAFLGHEMRGPAGTGRAGVSMAGGWEGQGARNGNGVTRLRHLDQRWSKTRKRQLEEGLQAARWRRSARAE